MDSEINYDKLIEKSLKGVVAEALKIAAAEGLPGEHHFYIGFRTAYPGTKIPPALKAQFPKEMTIVLQHQFSNLIVGTEGFSVDLSFGGVEQTLAVAYDSIVSFTDPHAKFGLQFAVDESAVSAPAASGSAQVVSIDAFRKNPPKKK